MKQQLRFRDGSLTFVINGCLTKASPPHNMLNFTSAEIDELATAFFEWMHSRGLEFGGSFGTEMEAD